MIDFLYIATRSTKRGVIEIYPKFIIKKATDLMIRGGDFYAIWIEENGLWSTDEQDAIRLIDHELDIYADEKKGSFDANVKILHMWDAESGMIDIWHKYCQKQMRDHFHMLDEKLIFSNTKTNKKDYASKRLSYPLEDGDISSYNTLMDTLYSKEERQKIEWAVGAIVSGDSIKIQKFVVLYGAAGTGKSTVLNIIQELFDGYYSVFDAKALGSSNNSFALEAFKNNPLIAIQHDGDLSRIEDNTRLNSLVSHEIMTVNEKFKSTYANRFKCFLFMGTNKPVKITDAKSGLIRRLIDVSPTGKKLGIKKYRELTNGIKFELGGIASHCKNVYEKNKAFYNDYIPAAMLGASNDFYNYVLDAYFIFKKENGVSLKVAWEMYKHYCEDSKVPYPFSKRIFKEELKNYFWEYDERYRSDNGSRIRSYYSNFRTDKFENDTESDNLEIEGAPLVLNADSSLFDRVCSDCPAQYATKDGIPAISWSVVETTLSDLDTRKMHYVKVKTNHIVIDFDLQDEKGSKDLKANIKEASLWPPTYAELSKSGKGVHLHYFYSGDVSLLNNEVKKNIEIKVFTGGSALRRKLTKCNDIPIRTLSSGLPMNEKRKDDSMINKKVVKSENGLRKIIIKNLKKEIHPGTKPSIDFIYKILNDAYESGLVYDVTNMFNDIFAFAANSTHNSEYCVKLVSKMKFKSEDKDPELAGAYKSDELVFFDIEIFPNLFVICYKIMGEGHPVVSMINPTMNEVAELCNYRLVGFNCRRYDNHIMYARIMGYSIEKLYALSQKIIETHSKNAFFREAYSLSYTDVYDFSSKKQSLKKFEIELGIHHQELGLPWDRPVSEDLWETVADYCKNDVLATEAVFNSRKADFTAREILADIAGMTVNDSTNTLTSRIIFGSNRKPQREFNYRDIGDPNAETIIPKTTFKCDPTYTRFTNDHKPIFPGYKYESGVSTYRGEKAGEGGFVYAEPGIYYDVALLDIASMHPRSVINENLFGDVYTKRFEDIVNIRLCIKHREFDKAGELFDGKLKKYLTDENTATDLAKALKIAINSVYGLTSASFENPFMDVRNKDNIVAKRGALFMINLKHEVQARGFTVAHIKTDSIKIPNATDKIIQFVMDYGSLYGYSFEHEATYDRMCLVNDAVYIAKYMTVERCYKLYGKAYADKNDDILKDNKKSPGEWTATGTQFQVPYVFKTLFSHAPLALSDLSETRSVTTSLYLDMNEGLPHDDLLITIKKIRDQLSDDPGKRLSKKSQGLVNQFKDLSNEELDKEIKKCHNYRFVGRVGQFCPIKPGKGGGILLREKDGRYYAVGGSKGYRWLESEMVKSLDKQDDIDLQYYEKIAEDAVSSISKYGSFDAFIESSTEEQAS